MGGGDPGLADSTVHPLDVVSTLPTLGRRVFPGSGRLLAVPLVRAHPSRAIWVPIPPLETTPGLPFRPGRATFPHCPVRGTRFRGSGLLSPKTSGRGLRYLGDAVPATVRLPTQQTADRRTRTRRPDRHPRRKGHRPRKRPPEECRLGNQPGRKVHSKAATPQPPSVGSGRFDWLPRRRSNPLPECF